MEENKICLKSVRELFGMNFFIPDYQRGYRWTEQQVEDLLNDIKDFKSNNPLIYQFYCVQPLVVRKMSENEVTEKKLEKGEWYEVIDGQQRLTTIYLILKVFQKLFPLAFCEIQLYSLKYQRNDALAAFFELPDNSRTEKDSDIDLYHISKAYSKIFSWLQKYWNCGIMDTLVQCDKDKNGRDKANNVRFIWYESVDENPIKVFTRLNIGKISLTNAELIKALILNRSNFKEGNNNITLRQQEIATKWDQIEYQLQKDEFWLFLNKTGYKNPTRIDFIFDLICDNDSLDLKEQYSLIGNDKNRTFRYFYEYFKTNKGEDALYQCWNKVQNYFDTFKEWYNDIYLYHYIGFLIAQEKSTIQSLYRQWNESKTKADFIKGRKEEIKKIIKTISLDFQYKIDGSDKWKCRPILLFHNIQTVINNNIAQIENDNYGLATFYKFPFHLYKLEKWDVEHINSNTTNLEEDESTRQEWLCNIYWSVSDEDRKKIDGYFLKETTVEQKNDIFSEIKKHIPVMNDWTSEQKNQIWNYALLDSSTNRGYGNAIFSAKRRIIISKDKGMLLPIPTIRTNGLFVGEAKRGQSSFVPPCTKNVFLKYYSPSANENNYWTISDAEYYKKDIEDCIQQLNECQTSER